MTIKVRNRINIGLFILSTVILICNIIYLIFGFSHNNPSFDIFSNKKYFLTQYSYIIPIISIIFLNLYVSVTSYALYRSFEKTQAANIIYFNLFLIGCLLDCIRLYIPNFHAYGTYSKLLINFGNIIVCSRLLIPIALLYTIIVDDVDKRHNTEQNLFIILLSTTFFAEIIPINTGRLNPNFTIDFSLKNILNLYLFIILIASIISIFINNYRNQNSQKTSFGFLFICIGLLFIFSSTNLIKLIIAIISMIFGTFYYLHELHKQYLWTD